MHYVGHLALAQLRLRRAPLSSSLEEVSSALRILGMWMITVSAGSPTVATMAAPPVVVPPVADPNWLQIYVCCNSLPVTLANPRALYLVWEGFP